MPEPSRPRAEAVEVETEVVPPEHPGERLNDPFLALVAKVMDSLFTLPGTKVKVGLDPIIGLLPGIGSPLSAAVSIYLLIRAAEARVPHRIMARMAVNILINALLDDLPVAGDVLSIFFRSNKMNYELLQKHAGTRRESTWRDYAIVGGIVFFVVAALVCFIIGVFVVLRSLVRHLT
jgi:hypothetical protein